MTLLTVQGTGPIIASLIFRLMAGRGPDSLVVPSSEDVLPAPREPEVVTATTG
jgi:hypothetical protein